MTKEGKIMLLGSLLQTLKSIPNNSGISTIDADIIFSTITAGANEEQLDNCIVIITETLEKIGTKMQNTNQEIRLLDISDLELSDVDNNTTGVNNLLNHF